MSLVAVSSSFSLAPSSHMEMMYNCWLPTPATMEQHKTHDDDPPTDAAMENNAEEEDRPGQFDIWNAIQSQKTSDKPLPTSDAAASPPSPYVHPLLRRSSSLLSQKSLEVCTESLGSETGSDDFSSCDSLDYYFSSKVEAETKDLKRETVKDMKQALIVDAPIYTTVEAEDWRGTKGRELTSVNYHCSISRKSPPRSFPPPLPSISRRDGPCFHMRPHRRDGRLVVEAVTVPSQNYLHAQREGGRLLLSFIDAIVHEPKSSGIIETRLKQEQVDKIAPEEDQEQTNGAQIVQIKEEDQAEVEEKNSYGEEEEEEEEEILDEEEEEEVEVVDRGTVVEVKVSTQPQQQSSATKVVRSSLVINKFVGGMPLSATTEECEQALDKNETKSNNSYAVTAAPPARRAVPTTTTTPAAAAVVAASTVSTISTDGYNEYYVHGSAAGPPLGELHAPLDNKFLFTSKRRNREELLHNMRRCSQLRRPLFIREPCCIATST